MNIISRSALWQKNPVLAWREMDAEIVIISPNDSVLHELNETASFIWKQLDGRRSAPDIAARLFAEYDVALGDALRDTEALLEQLAEQKLLLPVEQTHAGETP